MYREYYQLNRKPFAGAFAGKVVGPGGGPFAGPVSGPFAGPFVGPLSGAVADRHENDFFWPGGSFAGALARLRQGLGNGGILLLSGGAGSGKSCLLHHLAANFPRHLLWAMVADAGLPRLEFYQSIAAGFGLAGECSSKVAFLIQFSHFLHQAAAEGRQVVLLVDNGHRLSQEMLEELRLLAGLKKGDSRLLTIILAGREPLGALLERPKNRQLRRSLAANVLLAPLGVEQTGDYIRHRLEVAGAVSSPFTTEAVAGIHACSEGNPRRINTLGEHLLLAGAAAGSPCIDHELVADVVGKLGLPSKAMPEPPPVAGADNRKGLAGRRLLISAAAFAAASLLLAGLLHLYLEPGGRMESLSVIPAPTPLPTSLPPALLLPPSLSPGPLPIKRQEELPSSAPPPLAEGGGGGERGEELAQSPPSVATALLPTALSPGPLPIKRQEELPSSAPPPLAEGEGADEKEDEPSPIPLPIVEVEGGGESVQMAVEEAQVEQAPQPPLEPRRLRLPLQANLARLTPGAAVELERFVGKLGEYPRATLLVKGYVSSDNHSPENVALSRQRAVAVQQLLLAAGVEEERVTIQGMGALEPLASNATPAGREKNRRVEIEVVDDGTRPLQER